MKTTITILSAKGDEKIFWGDDTGITTMEQDYDDLKKKGYEFHQLIEEEKDNETVWVANGIIRNFKDLRKQENVIAIPRYTGG